MATSTSETTVQLPEMDLDFDTTAEASALQAVADSIAEEPATASNAQDSTASQQPPQQQDQAVGASSATTETTTPKAQANSTTAGEATKDASSSSNKANDSSSDSEKDKNSKKRPSTSCSSTDPNAPPAKVTKRRAARACVSCRARKVRCDVVEGAPCGNCRWDNVECVVQESRRRKKTLLTASTATTGNEAQLRAKGTVNIQSNAELRQYPQQQSHQPIQQSPSPIAMSQSASSHSHNNSTNSNLHNTGGVATAPAPANSMPLNNSGSGLSLGGTSPAEQHGNGMSGGRSGGADGYNKDASNAPHMMFHHQQQSGFRQDTSIFSKLQTAASQDVNARRLLANLITQAQAISNPATAGSNSFGDFRTSQFLASLEEPDLQAQLPPFVKPLPSRIASEDVKYLHAKGALSLPPLQLQNALLQAYVEYVHPYMPLIDLYEFLATINSKEGLHGQVSLFLYQAIMFAATAFVDMKTLREAGYTTRKAARRAFFQKTRLLYDFDYESDRLVLVQALLLMTYWYETPDDQKDTWHWMGVAISLAHTIGLHRNPATTSMPLGKQKLWKRIWWSCFMRDRLVALGMRRPTRIKDEDYDVPMLTESDFESEVLPEDNTVIPPECTLVRDLSMQQELATLCVAKAKLCLCISSMLKAQYSVLIRDKMRPDNTVNSTMMLFPNKQLDNFESVTTVDLELMSWAESLPAVCQYRPLTPLDVKNGRSTIAVQRHLLHMVYYTTISALHRPQFLPSSPTQAPTASRQAQEVSRHRVRDAAAHITRMGAELHQYRLEKFLPTTGVTVMLPAMIIHLLEMKNPVTQARDRAARGFRQCMRVMEKLREIYAAADYATGFLDAALSKASIEINANNPAAAVTQQNLKLAAADPSSYAAQTPPPENAPYMTSAETSMFTHNNEKSNMPVPPTTNDMGGLPETINVATLDLSVTGIGAAAAAAVASPPPTDKDLESAIDGISPSASGSSEGVEPLDMDFFNNQQDIDWNAVAGTEFDMDQWLQFPPEGVNNSDEGFMANMFSTVSGGEEPQQQGLADLAMTA